MTPRTAARQASLSITNSRSLLKLMSIESVMPSSHLILCHPLLLLPSIFHSIRVFSNESFLCIKWAKYWSFSFSISPSSEHSGLISFRMDWLDFLLPHRNILVKASFFKKLAIINLYLLCTKKISFLIWLDFLFLRQLGSIQLLYKYLCVCVCVC